MKKRFFNIAISLLITLVFFVSAYTILVNGNRKIDFDYEVYLYFKEDFIVSNDNYYEISNNLSNYIDDIKLVNLSNEINDSIYDYFPKTDRNISFVSLSDKQLSELANTVIENSKLYFNSEEISLLETVYAIDENVSIYTNQPRKYLFYVMTNDKQNMVAVEAFPTKDDFEINFLWEVNKSNDFDFVLNEVNRNMFIYTNKIV